VLLHNVDYNVFIYGVLAALLSLFLDYCLGLSGAGFSPREIFSGYTNWIVRQRLGNKVKEITESYKFEDEYDRDAFLYSQAEPLFTWEKAAGMCVVCTGFWIALVTGIFYTFSPVSIFEIILTSHVTIRIITKLL
jgi:hypothetical protein